MIWKILIPVLITLAFIGIRKLYQYKSWQNELKRDEAKRKLIDRLLEVDAEDWASGRQHG